MAVTDRIDLQPEIAQWKDAPYGRDVRAANVAAFEKIETSVNAAIDNVNQASENANQAVTSADGAASRAETAETNAKKAAEDAKKAAEDAENITGIGIMTTDKAGIGKPDGETINADVDGTMRAIILDALGLAGEAGQSVGMQVMIDAVAQKVANELLKKTDVISQIINDATKAASMAALYSVNQKVGDTSKLPAGVADLATAAAQLYSNLEVVKLDTSKITYAPGFIGSGPLHIYKMGRLIVVTGSMTFSASSPINGLAISNLPVSCVSTWFDFGSSWLADSGNVMGAITGTDMHLAGNPTSNVEYRYQFVTFEA